MLAQDFRDILMGQGPIMNWLLRQPSSLFSQAQIQIRLVHTIPFQVLELELHWLGRTETHYRSIDGLESGPQFQDWRR